MSCSQCGPKKKEGFFESTRWQVIALLSSVALLALSYIFWTNQESHKLWFKAVNPAWAVIVVCGFPLFKGAFVSLFKRKKIVSALLITVAMIACVALEIYGWFNHDVGGAHTHYLFAAGEIAFLMFLGEAIENYTVKKSNKGIEKLFELAPTHAFIKVKDEFSELPIDFVQVGDTVLIKPNSMISIDGTVVKGSSSALEASITGEGLPADKSVGDAVFAGTTNLDGVLEVRVSKASDETAVAKMIKLVEQAEEKKAPIARLADRWAGIIVPAAITLCILVIFFARIALSVDWITSVVRGVTILVVFCPCSLALATPTAVAAGIGNASAHGIIIKSGQALEEAAKTDVVCFDKTGTLTAAQITVRGYETIIDKDEFKAYVGSAEAFSEHPVSIAVTREFGSKYEAQNTRSIMGVGVSATVNGAEVLVGKWDFFDKGEERFEAFVSAWLGEGCTVVGVSVNGVLAGTVALKDTVRESARGAVSSLNGMGIQTVMLTGDNSQSADAVAREVGIGQVKSKLLPEQKVQAVEGLKAAGKRVLMVGDGVNDAPSLATANVSMAMGVMGNTVAMEVADMSIMNNNLDKIPYTLSLSRKTLSTIKRNIAISMCINVISVVLSAWGKLDPTLGAVVHNCSSVFVVTSSALLLLAKPKKRRAEHKNAY